MLEWRNWGYSHIRYLVLSVCIYFKKDRVSREGKYTEKQSCDMGEYSLYFIYVLQVDCFLRAYAVHNLNICR